MTDPMTGEYEARFREAARKAEMPVEALQFVLQGFRTHPVPMYSHTTGQPWHIDGAELCWRVHDLAISEFGPRARAELESWGIHSTDDIGRIVLALIDEGLVFPSEQDTPDDYHEVYDFENAFREYRLPRPESGRPQWTISAMLLVTTIAAIAFAGASRLGIQGAIGTLASCWLALIGGLCLWLSIRDRSQGWLVAVCVGIAILAIGLFGFLLIIL